jgi:integrase
MTLGAYPGVSLKLARDRAREVRAEVQRGGDPIQDRKREEEERRLTGFASCAQQYIEQYAMRRQKAWKDTERVFRKFAVPAWGERPIKEIRRRDVVRLLDEIAETTPHQANRLRICLSRMYKWLIEREVVETSPILGVAPRVKSRARSRILSEAELAALWIATERVGSPFGPAIRFLMLTGVRRSEGACLRWEELDGNWAAMPASRMKGGRDFRAAMPDAAKAIVEGMPRICEYVFTTTGRSPISGWSKYKLRLDAIMTELLGEPVPDWRLHDLRRTLASGLAALGFRAEIIKRVLGHAAKSNDVTEAHYNWYNYDAEALAAVQKWAEHLAASKL